MDPLQMDSIWLEDDARGKLNVSLPNVEVLNSDTPILGSRNTVQLPPLPPTSYFTTLMEKQEEQERLRKKNGAHKFLDAFKKLSKTTEGDEKGKLKNKKKISTPFGFSHISHVDKGTTITNRTFIIPVPVPNSEEIKDCTDNTDTSMGISFNRTSPQRNTSTSSGHSGIPRSHSQTTSLASNTFSVGRGSVSTVATSRMMSLSRKPTHSHSVSSSSIEQLAKLEKFQISKQCHPSYRSDDLLDTPSFNKDVMTWDTPSPNNAVRQSWVYAFDSPSQPKLYSTDNTQLRESLLVNQTPMKQHIDSFANALDKSFDEGPEFAEIQRDMKELNVLFGVQKPVEDDDVQEAVASLRAANFTRLSRDLVRDISEEVREKLAHVITVDDEVDNDEEYVTENEEDITENGDDVTENGEDVTEKENQLLPSVL